MTIRYSYTYVCTVCHDMYSWIPETEDEKPRRCRRSTSEKAPCPGHGVRL